MYQQLKRKNQVCENQGKENCIKVLEEKGRQARAARKQEFVAENQKQWLITGMEFREWRLCLGLSAAYVAWEMGISVKRLQRFENGEPVRYATQIERQYERLLYSEEDREEMERLRDENNKLKSIRDHASVVVEVNGQRWTIPAPTTKKPAKYII